MKIIFRLALIFILGCAVIRSNTITLANHDTYINSLTTINFLGLSTTVSNNLVLDVLVNTYAYRFRITGKTGSMWGSSYNNFFTDDSNYNRVAQHALPSEADFVSPQNVIFVYTNVGRRSSYSAVTRNGFTSSSWPGFDGVKLHYIIYYSSSDSKIYAHVNNSFGIYTPGNKIDITPPPAVEPVVENEIMNKKIILKDVSDATMGTMILYSWVNYSSNVFNSQEGNLVVDNSAKLIYNIKDNSNVYITSGSTSLENRFKQYVLNYDMSGTKGHIYVAWDIKPKVGFCNCSNNSKVGNGVGEAKIKFFHCLNSAKRFYDYVGVMNPTYSRLIKTDTEVLSYLDDSNTFFADNEELEKFFNGKLLAKHILACKSMCAA